MPADVLGSVRPPSLRWSQLPGLSAVGKLAQRIVDLPGNQFMALMHEHFADRRAKAPLLPGVILGVRSADGGRGDDSDSLDSAPQT